MRFVLPCLVVAVLLLWSGSLFAGDKKLPEAAVVYRGGITAPADCADGSCSLKQSFGRAGSRSDARYNESAFFSGPVAAAVRAKPIRALAGRFFGRCGSGCR